MKRTCGTYVVLIMVFVAACGKETLELPDAAVAPPDGAVDVLADSTSPDAAVDLGVADLASDVEDASSAVDRPLQPDLISSPVHKLTFAFGVSPTLMNVITMNSDGTGYQKVQGFTNISLTFPTTMTGRVEDHFPINHNGPHTDRTVSTRYIRLPRGLGALRWYYGTFTKRVGILLNRPTGDVQSLYTTIGADINALSNLFSLSRSGDMVAAVVNKTGIVMARTDGTLFENGKVYKEVWPKPTPVSIIPTSVTFVGKYLYFVTEDSVSTFYRTLWRLPIDGTAVPTPVVLPKVGGAATVWVESEIASDSSGNVAVVTAGNYTATDYSTYEDVFAVHADGSVVNVSKDPGDYDERHPNWGNYRVGREDDPNMMSRSGAQIALNPMGTHVAFVKNTPWGDALYVGPTDGNSAPVLVTELSAFTGGPAWFFNLRFLDDKTLIFCGGKSFGSSSAGYTAKSDIYRYDVGQQMIQRLTGSPNKPYDLSGTRYIQGMWISPNGRYLYFVDAPNLFKDANIRAIDTQTWLARDITTGANLDADDFGGIVSCEDGSRLFAAAGPDANMYNQEELLVVDLDKATPAAQITSFGPTLYGRGIYINEIIPSPDCSHVAFSRGSSGYDVYVSGLKAPYSVVNVTNDPNGKQRVFDMMQFSPNADLFVFFTGYSYGQYDMRVAPAGVPGFTRTLRTADNATTRWVTLGVD